MEYEAVIGLETHAELDTRTKLFCGCATTFGTEPNTQTCPVCLGLPGVLPALNRKAFEYALRTALALQCRIAPVTTFDRKNYYYPDLPKNYQISQNYVPVGTDGAVAIPVGGRLKNVHILNVHLEEDAGKLIHPDDNPLAGSLVDLNRAGVPLVEIVSAPDMRSVHEVESYMHTLRNILLCLEVSDCKMEEGSLRFEASISLRPAGATKLGNRVEIKNLNSTAAVLKALQHEIERQTRELERGNAIEQETRLWSDADGRTDHMRSKEDAHDYRYFPEPDLVPVSVTDDQIEAARRALPELPVVRAARFVESCGLSEYDANLLTGERRMAQFFEDSLAVYPQPKKIANWMTNQLAATLKEKSWTFAQVRMKPADLALLVRMVDEGGLSARNAAELLPELVETGSSPDELVAARGLKQISDLSGLEATVDKILAENPKVVADWKAGKAAALNRLLGSVMKETGGRANPSIVRELLQKKLSTL